MGFKFSGVTIFFIVFPIALVYLLFAPSTHPLSPTVHAHSDPPMLKMFQPSSGLVVAYVTAPTSEVAKSIAVELVKSKLVACVNIVPGIVSVYNWENAVEESNEVLMMIKTRQELMEQVTQTVKKLHPYQVPEVISVGIEGGLDSYLNWVKAETKSGASSVADE